LYWQIDRECYAAPSAYSGSTFFICAYLRSSAVTERSEDSAI
jgi:hypothetical protein